MYKSSRPRERRSRSATTTERRSGGGYARASLAIRIDAGVAPVALGLRIVRRHSLLITWLWGSSATWPSTALNSSIELALIVGAQAS
jgi:hypothetical protein